MSCYAGPVSSLPLDRLILTFLRHLSTLDFMESIIAEFCEDNQSVGARSFIFI